MGHTPQPAPSPTAPAVASTPAGPLAVGQRLVTYELLEKLGEGGMGTVWKARHVKLDKLVALKVLPQHLTNDPETVRRFEREMRAVGKVEHANVIRAMDAGEVGGLHYLVMEYVEGVDLSKYIKQRGPRSVADACTMVRHAALGLAAAHAQGLIHRDIKPSNLLLSKQGQVKVLDLGLAKLMAEGPEARQLTQSGQVLGTPDFMAPEQWDDAQTVDHRADLYALGCTLCFLLTGQAPYGDQRHSTFGQKMKGHMLEPSPRLRDLRPEAPEELDALFAQLMVKDPAKRSLTAAELAQRLKEIVQHQSGKTVAKGERDQPTATASMSSAATAPTHALPRMAETPVSNSPTDAGTEATQIEIQVKPEPKVSSARIQRRPPRWLALAAGGAAAVVLLGVIIIKITKKDGSTVEIVVPDDVKKVEVVTSDAKPATAKVEPAGFVSLFNGKDLTGWMTAQGTAGNWKVENGSITCKGGPRDDLYSVRDDFGDFHLRAEVKVNATGNSGIYFRAGKPLASVNDYEAQICIRPDQQKTGSLWGLSVCNEAPVTADTWFSLEIIAKGSRIQILINGALTADFDEQRPARREKGFLALQYYDANTVVHFRKIEIREFDNLGTSAPPRVPALPKP